MADRSIFTRLKRLFSTQAVVRNTGGKRLKVKDIGMTQAYGSRNVIDRYRRVYSAGQYGYNAQGHSDSRASYHQARLQLFRDYDLMDADPIVSSVLDIYADESTVKNEYSQILTITSEDDEIQSVLHNLFYDVLNIEFNLWPWTRNMCKYGDFYLFLNIHDEYGIINTLPLSVYELQRIEGDPEGNNPFYVQFRMENQYDFLSGRQDFENYEIAHFRLLSDTNYLPYGKAMIEGGRRIYKQLRLMEDAMLIHRITRAPDKRKIKIDVGNIPPAEIEAHMQNVITEMKRSPIIDKQTGDYNMRFNMQNIMEDFYLPVRGKDSGTDIENLGGLEYAAIDDIEYLLHKELAAYKVPKSFLGYEKDTSGKATLAAQDIRFARTIERVQKILVSELNKIAIVHLYVLGYRDESLLDFSLALTNPSTVYELEKLNLWKEKAILSDQLTEGRYLSRPWVYKNIWSLSTEEVTIEQDNVLEDARWEGEVQKEMQESMQPEGGAPGQEPPVQEEEVDPYGAEKNIDDVDQLVKNGAGRPPEGVKYRTDSHPKGRDPLGYKEILGAMDVLPKQNKPHRTYMNPAIKEALKGIKGGKTPSMIELLNEDEEFDLIDFQVVDLAKE